MLQEALSTPVEPSRICLGGVPLGSSASKEVSFAIMDEFRRLGGKVAR